ncbi:MAG: decarboxylating 6-phosphogluconate dehydrogenase [bacterium]
MKIAFNGLGRMGANMVTRLLRGGHEVVVYNRSIEPVEKAVLEGAINGISRDLMIDMILSPRVVWLMLPAGEVTEEYFTFYLNKLSPGDIIVDGANSRYTDSEIHAEYAADKGIMFVDAGISGGIWGLTEGYSTMVGGCNGAVEHIRPLIETLAPAPDRGWGHVGPAGSGHFVKMVHNGIEYGMMQALAEGFELLKAKNEFDLDLYQIAELWRDGSVVRSWLLDLTAAALKDNQSLDGIAPYVADSGEGRWTALEGINLGVALPVITLALQRRFLSQDDNSYSAKILAAMRKGFGGHAIKGE